MNYSGSVMKILNGAQELQKVVSGESFVESTLLVFDLDEGEEIALLDELKHNKEHLYCLPARFDDDLALTIVFH